MIIGRNENLICPANLLMETLGQGTSPVVPEIRTCPSVVGDRGGQLLFSKMEGTKCKLNTYEDGTPLALIESRLVQTACKTYR